MWISATCIATQLYGQDHLVVRQLQPKKSGSFSPAFSAFMSGGSDGKAQMHMEANGRNLEFRRLADATPPAEWGAQTAKWAAQGNGRTEGDGRLPKTQQSREELVQEISAQVDQRTQQVRHYAAEAQERMAGIKHLLAEEAEDLEEVVYTLGNWTALLPPELRLRAETAKQHMQGILKDPGVRGIWVFFGGCLRAKDLIYHREKSHTCELIPVSELEDTLFA